MPKQKLRDSLIRLAYQKPEFRKDLMPLLKEAANGDEEGYDPFEEYLSENYVAPPPPAPSWDPEIDAWDAWGTPTERSSSDKDYFDELKDTCDKDIRNWLRKLPRLAEKYIPEYSDMRYMLGKSHVEADYGDVDYRGDVIVKSEGFTALVRDAQRRNGHLADKHFEKRFEKFASDAARILMQMSEFGVDDESVFWLEEMKILGRDKCSFEIYIQIHTMPDPTPY